jgi:hypothetical protein
MPVLEVDRQQQTRACFHGGDPKGWGQTPKGV